jgi:hypothetical protein
MTTARLAARLPVHLSGLRAARHEAENLEESRAVRSVLWRAAWLRVSQLKSLELQAKLASLARQVLQPELPLAEVIQPRKAWQLLAAARLPGLPQGALAEGRPVCCGRPLQRPRGPELHSLLQPPLLLPLLKHPGGACEPLPRRLPE